MDQIEGYTLDEFLELAVRQNFIESYKKENDHVILVIEGKSHKLDHNQAWSFLSGTLYDWWLRRSFEDE